MIIKQVLLSLLKATEDTKMAVKVASSTTTLLNTHIQQPMRFSAIEGYASFRLMLTFGSASRRSDNACLDLQKIYIYSYVQKA